MLVDTAPKTINISTTPALEVETGGPVKGALELHVDVKTAAQFLGVSPALVYSYVTRKQIPHYRMMGRTIRFLLSELAVWRQQFHIDGGIHE